MYTSITITTVKTDIEHFCPPKKVILCSFLISQPPSPSYATRYLLFVTIDQVVFCRLVYKQNHLKLAAFSPCHIFKVYSTSLSVGAAHSFLLRSSIPLQDHVTICLLPYFLMGGFIVSSLGLQRVKLVWLFTYNFLNIRQSEKASFKQRS